MRSHAKAASVPSTHRENATFSLGVLAAMLVCAAAFLGIGAPAASAAPEAKPGYGYLTEFSSPEFSPFAFAESQPSVSAIAVDSHGNVFVPVEQLQKIEVFAPDASAGGTPLTTIDTAPFWPRDIAIDPGTDDLYVKEIQENLPIPRIVRFQTDGNATPTYTLDPSFDISITSAQGIAVDPTNHDLLVADRFGEAIYRYDSSGTLINTMAGMSLPPVGVVVAPNGDIYAAPNVDPATSQGGTVIWHMDDEGSLLDEIDAGGLISAFTLDAANERLLVVVGNQLKYYSTDGSLLSEISTPADSASGLAVDPDTHRLYQFTGSAAAPGAVYVYNLGTLAGVEPPVVSAISTDSVHVSTEVEPGAGPPAGSAVKFEYSDDGGASWASSVDQPVGAAGTYEAGLSGLKPNWEYQVRAVAFNSLTFQRSSVTKFTTAGISPEVQTEAATDVSETGAVLNATINPVGLQSTYYFEYGTTEAYGSKLPVGIEGVAGGGREPRSFHRTIAGLSPGTTYHYRIVATNSVGTSFGADRSFTTEPAAGILHRVYEQATPVNKHGVPVEPSYGVYAKSDGNGVSYIVRNGQNGSPLNARALNLRGTDNWGDGLDLDPTLNVYKTGVLTQATLGLSADFSRALVVSNQALAPGAVEESANLYLFDTVTREYTLVGTAPPLSFALNTFTGYGFGGNMLAAAPDFSWIVFYSDVPLLGGAPFKALYRWSDSDGLEVVSILPGPSPSQATIAAPGSDSPVQPPASADSSRIYFAAAPPEPGVYLRENGDTRAVSVSEVDGEPTGAQKAAFLGTSEDGRYAFIANLVVGAKLTNDADGVLGDIYRYDAVDDDLAFLGDQIVAASTSQQGVSEQTVGVSDDGDALYYRGPLPDLELRVWRSGQIQPITTGVTPAEAFMSPGGRYLVYHKGGQGEIYLYDSITEETNCMSCPPGATQGKGLLSNGINRTPGEHRTRVVNDNGQAFFTTSERLVAADVNGVNDVYEYRDGRATLISPGNAPKPALFVESTPDGNSVFFSTGQKLVGQDNDESIDIYSARVGGGLAGQNPPPPQECLRDDCKPTPPGGPELPFGGSEALSGPGNVTAPKHKRCGKGRKAKKITGKVRCVKKHSKHRANKSRKGGDR